MRLGTAENGNEFLLADAQRRRNHCTAAHMLDLRRLEQARHCEIRQISICSFEVVRSLLNRTDNRAEDVAQNTETNGLQT